MSEIWSDDVTSEIGKTFHDPHAYVPYLCSAARWMRRRQLLLRADRVEQRLVHSSETIHVAACLSFAIGDDGAEMDSLLMKLLDFSGVLLCFLFFR